MYINTKEVLGFVQLPWSHLDCAVALHPPGDVPYDRWDMACTSDMEQG